MLNLDNEQHAAADERLRAEVIIWLTTVSASGQPQTSPVWFEWNGSEFLIYGSKNGQKSRNIAVNPRVGLHLDGNGQGGGNIIFEGTATIDSEPASVETIPVEFKAKYGARIEAYGWTMTSLVRDYPDVIKVTPTRVRIW